MVKNILIVGAGVAGLHCAQRLAKKAPANARIMLVDSSDVHTLKADLYEVATAFNKEITDECMVQLKAAVATPIVSLVDPERVHFLQDSVMAIDTAKKTVKLKKNKVLHYDILVLALGSVTNFFKVPGIEKYAFPLKTVHEALAINCHLDRLFRERWTSRSKAKAIHITIGGGGATGVEMASELYASLKKLCRKYKFPRAKVHVQLVQSGQDLGGLDDKGTEKILSRLEGMGVCVYRGFRISKVTEDSVLMKDSKNKLKTLPNSMLIWTAGVSVHPVVAALGDAKKGGAVEVDATLESKKFPKVFAAGDNAFLEDPKKPGSRVPMLAYAAWQEGNVVADNIVRSMRKEKLRDYNPGDAWMILPLGGKFAAFKCGPFLITGFAAWLLRRLVIFRYHFSTMSFRRAFKKWHKGGELFEQND
ncbi:MAG: FAD-dependent oxidoreductase [Patescibacteria group bacterium]